MLGNPNAKDVCRKGVARAVARKSKQELPVPTPFMRLNAMLGGGLWASTLGVLIAAPAAGKTQLATQMSMYAAKRGNPTVYLSLEIEAAQMGLRSMASEVGVSWSGMFTGNCSDTEIRRCNDWIDRNLDDVPLWILESEANRMGIKNLQEIINDLEQHTTPKTPGFIVVDYLHLLAGDEDEESVREIISNNTKKMKRMIRGRNVSILVISSAGRKKTDLDGQEPNLEKLMESGKESGDIEFNVDLQMVLCREIDKDTGRSSTILAVPKNRIGEAGWFKVPFEGGVFKEL